MKFSIKDFFSKCDLIRKKLRIWSHLLKKSLMENFTFYVVYLEHLDLRKGITKLNKWRNLNLSTFESILDKKETLNFAFLIIFSLQRTYNCFSSLLLLSISLNLADISTMFNVFLLLKKSP